MATITCFLLDGNPVYHVNHLLGFFLGVQPGRDKEITPVFIKGSFSGGIRRKALVGCRCPYE